MAEKALQKVTDVEMAEQPSPPVAHDPLVSMIERVALDPNADIDKLERMLEMKERLERTSAQTDFNEALAAAQAAMPSVAAKHNNDQTRSKYAKLADIYEACKPIAAQHGFSFNAVPVTGAREGFMNMKWTLRRGAHIESDVSEVPLDDKGMKGTANKTGTHAYGSTTSYGRRYLFCAVFDIAIGDDNDGNARRGPVETITAEQAKDITDFAGVLDVPTERICKAAGIAEITDLPATAYDSVMKKLKQTKAAREAQTDE